MNFKKFIAGAAAFALAVSAITVTSFADDGVKVTSSFTQGEGTYAYEDNGTFRIDVGGDTGVPGVDPLEIAGVDVVFSYELPGEEDYAGGSFVFSGGKIGWQQQDWTSDETVDGKIIVKSGEKVHVDMPEGKSFTEEDGWTAIIFQNFGVVDYNIDSIDILDASGNVLVSLSEGNAPEPVVVEGGDEEDGDGEDAEPIELNADDFESVYTLTINAYDLDQVTGDAFYSQVQMGHINHIKKITVSATNGVDTVYLNMAKDWDAEEAVEANGIEWQVEGLNPWTGAGLYFPEGVYEIGDDSWTVTIEAEVDVQELLDYWVTPEPDGLGYGAEGIHDLTIFVAIAFDGNTSMTLADKGSGDNTVVIPLSTGGGDNSEDESDTTTAAETEATTAPEAASDNGGSGWIIWLIVGIVVVVVVVVVIIIVAKKKK